MEDMAARYRREAAILRREAPKIRDEELRQQLLHIANSYDKIAEIFESRKRGERARNRKRGG
jgi:hypothetical protein